MSNDIFGGIGIRVKLRNVDDFLIICETLTRIGIPGRDKISKDSPEQKRKFYQSCHILHKKGEYAILHFKEFFKLEGKPCDISENDISRRNTIVNMLERWGLLTIVDKERIGSNVIPDSHINVIKSKEKAHWELICKYRVGNRTK